MVANIFLITLLCIVSITINEAAEENTQESKEPVHLFDEHYTYNVAKQGDQLKIISASEGNSGKKGRHLNINLNIRVWSNLEVEEVLKTILKIPARPSGIVVDEDSPKGVDENVAEDTGEETAHQDAEEILNTPDLNQR